MKNLLPSLMSACLVWFAAQPTLAAEEGADVRPGLNEATLAGLQWREIGPALMSGRIADIAIDPVDRSIWYVAVGSGGVWKTVNAGTTWTPIFDDQGSYSIGCITIDPERDDPARVGEYARYFDPSFIGLSGTLDEITDVAKRHFVIFAKVPLEDSNMGYTMDHSSIVYVVGKDGVIQSMIHHGETPAGIAKVLREALKS